MVASDRENAKTAQQVEITHSIAIKKVLALPLLEPDVVADCFQDAYQLFVQVARMHGTALRLPLHKHLGNV